MSVIKRKRKNKTFYEATIYIRGVRMKSKTFSTQALAYTWHDREKTKFQTGKAFLEEELQEIKLEDCVRKYLKEYVPKLKPSSQRSLEKALNQAVLKSPLSQISMADLRAFHIDQWLEWAFQKFRAERRKSFKTEFKRLTAVLNWWRNYVDPNFVVPIIKPHRERAYQSHKKVRRPDYFARPEEIRDWLEELQKLSNPIYYRVAQFLLLTGVRIGEACGLKWSDVSLEEKTARVLRCVDWGPKGYAKLTDSPKTESSVRLLLLPNELVKTLHLMRVESPRSSLVFHNEMGELLKYNTIRLNFNEAFKACGLPWRGTHICRHTYATMALMATKSLSAVQASLGHKDQVITQRYAKAVALLTSDMAEKTAQMYNMKTLGKTQKPTLLESQTEPRTESRTESRILAKRAFE